MLLSEFFMPITVVAFLITFGNYFSTHWFGIFMPSLVGLELLMFMTTGQTKIGEKVESPKVDSAANKDLLAARQRNTEEEQHAKQLEELKKATANPKQEKANAKKAAQAEKAATTASKKKTA